jgi:uncharacterized RDD family membrane protein YckC
MNNITSWIHKNIFWIALYLGVSALSFELAYVFTIEPSDLLIVLDQVFNFGAINLQFLMSRAFEIEIRIDDYSSYSYNTVLLVSIFYSLFIIGAFLFRFIKAKRILSFCLSVILIGTVINVVKDLHWIATSEDVNGFVFLWLLKSLVVFIVVLMMLRKLLASEERMNEDETISGHPEFKLLRARWYDRLFNVYLDAFITILVFSTVVFSYENSIADYMEDFISGRIGGLLLFAIFSTLYYLFFEGILKTTPGKILTNSRVVAFNGKPVGFGWIFLRTMSRRIPFNGLSFFGKIGWHDSISETTVVKLTKEKQQHVRIYIALFLIILGILLYFVFNDLRWY